MKQPRPDRKAAASRLKKIADGVLAREISLEEAEAYIEKIEKAVEVVVERHRADGDLPKRQKH